MQNVRSSLVRAVARRRVAILSVISLLPALALVALLFGASVVYGIRQSLGYIPLIGQDEVSLSAYRNVVAGSSAAALEFWPALGFSLWVSGAAALVSALGALLLVVVLQGRNASTTSSLVLNLNLAFPHLVWAVALGLLLTQSGLFARLANLVGLIERPAEFPVLVRDRYGIGIILTYVSKGIPFLALIVLAILRSQPEGYELVAENLGATRWQRLRYVIFPLVLPGLLAGALLVFALAFGAYEVPALLGVRYPRMLAVLALEFFINTDLSRRAEGMAVSVMMAVVVLLVAGAARWLSTRRGDTH
jgi:putative spermidine/putrescine transport system permease protein